MSVRDPLIPARFTETDERWKARAACRDTPDPDAFFPFPGDEAGIKRAKAVCARCPVAGPCLAYGIATGSVGVFGGTTERQRARLRANRARRQRTNHQPTHRKEASMTNRVNIRNVPGGAYSIAVWTDGSTVGDLKRALQRLPEDARITDYDGDGELLMIEAIPASLIVPTGENGGAETA